MCSTLLETSRRFCTVAVPLDHLTSSGPRAPALPVLWVLSSRGPLAFLWWTPTSTFPFSSVSPGAQEQLRGNADLVSLHETGGLSLSSVLSLPCNCQESWGPSPAGAEVPAPPSMALTWARCSLERVEWACFTPPVEPGPT